MFNSTKIAEQIVENKKASYVIVFIYLYDN